MSLVESKQSVFNDDDQNILELCPARNLLLIDGLNEHLLIRNQHQLTASLAEHGRFFPGVLQKANMPDSRAD